MGWAIFVLKWLFAYLLGGISFVTLLLGAGWCKYPRPIAIVANAH